MLFLASSCLLYADIYSAFNKLYTFCMGTIALQFILAIYDIHYCIREVATFVSSMMCTVAMYM